MRKLFILFFVFLATTALWAYDFQSGDLYYNVISKSEPYTVEVTSKSTMSPYNKDVTCTTIVVPDSVVYNDTTFAVTSIGDNAFSGCTSLVDISVSNNVKFIGLDAFAGTPWYAALTDGLVYINDVLYKYVGAMPAETSIEIAEGTVSISPYAFADCANLVSVKIPESVISIGASAFKGCSSLSKITIPKNMISVGALAFANCTSLTTIEWNATGTANSYTHTGNPSLPPSLADGMFVGNSGPTDIFSGTTDYVTSVVFGEEVEHIPARICENMKNLTSVILPDSLKTIGTCAFANSSLSSITIPVGVTFIGDAAFACDSLSVIWNAKKCEDFFYSYAIGGAKSKPFSEIISIVFGDSVEYIPSHICYRTPSLTSVHISNSVTSIGDYAFYGTSISSLDIPNTLGSIGPYAFTYCDSLENVTLGKGLEQIGELAFCGCISLKSIVIPDNVRIIGSSAFEDCDSLSVAIIGNGVTDLESSVFRECKTLDSVVIGNSVKNVGKYAFFGCASLVSIVLPKGVESIGEFAFSKCNSLTSISLPNNLTRIEYSAFRDCSKLPSITIPLGVTSFGKAFAGCTELTSVTWNAKRCEDGENSPFYNICEHITTFTFGDSVEYIPYALCNSMPITSIRIPKEVTGIAAYAFGNCPNLTRVDYEGNLNGWCKIQFGNQYANPNINCKNLYIDDQEVVDVVFPNTIDSIQDYAFYGCTKLSSLFIPKNITYIGKEAFGECKKLYDIYCYASEPPVADATSFANYNVNLYALCDYLKDYEMHDVFGNFKFIQCIGSEEVVAETVTVVPSVNDVTITWPTEAVADKYVIVIKQNATIFCSLTFNADGQLLNIAFVPGRDGNHPAQFASQDGNAYRFTVTGLEEATHYAYDIIIKDADDAIIHSHSGEFITQSNVSSSIENYDIQYTISDNCKLLDNGQLIILHDGITYTIMGQKIE